MRQIYLLVALCMLNLSIKAQVTTNSGSGMLPNYPSLDAAITDLNSKGTVTGSVLITLTGSEVAPAGGYAITANGGPFTTIQINGNGNTVTASPSHTPGSLTDAVIKVIGGDYVSIVNFRIMENPANTIQTEATNTMTEWGIALLNASPTNGPQNNNITGNFISLVRTYPNAFGIYTNSNHSATAISPIVSATSGAGRNRNININTNEIKEVNLAIVAIGTPGVLSDIITIGNPSLNNDLSGNFIDNYGDNDNFADYPYIKRTIASIMVINFSSVLINRNTMFSANGLHTAGVFRGIVIDTAGLVVFPIVGNPPNINIKSNTISIRSSLVDGLVEGIYNGFGSLTTTLSISRNNFNIFGIQNVNPTADVNFIHNVANTLNQFIDSNTYDNITLNTVGEINLIKNAGGIYGSGTQLINNNSVLAGGTFTRTATATDPTQTITRGIYTTESALSSPNANITIRDNIFSNFILPGNNTFIGIENRDGGGSGLIPSTGVGKTITGNKIQNIKGQTGTGSTYGIWVSNGSAMAKPNIISNNEISDIETSNSFIAGIFVDNSLMLYNNVAGNKIYDLATTSGEVVGIHHAATTSVTRKNMVYDLMASGMATGIKMAGSDHTTDANLVYNISTTGSGMETANGIWASLTSPTVMAASGTIFNNYIGHITAPNSSSLTAVSGLNLIGDANAAFRVYYNTIYINGTSSAATFGTSGILFSNNVGSLDLRNTIVVNVSTPANTGANMATNGIAAAVRRTMGTQGMVPANYAMTSNNNLFWVNPSPASNVRMTYAEGGAAPTNLTRSVDNAKAFFGNRDQNSWEELPPFISTTPGLATYLHINASVQTFVESNAQPIGFITVDFDDDPRNAATPDIGADEINGILPVEFTNFTGQRIGIDNVLSWKTATESQNKGFEVLRSLDGANFSSIGYVASKAVDGNSQSALSYEYKDLKTSEMTYFYQLRQRDIDGGSKLSNIIKIDGQEFTRFKINTVFPNPATNSINTLVFAPGSDKLNVSIIDMNGRVLSQSVNQVERGNNTISVNVRNLGRGTYIMKITNQEGEVELQRFIKH